MSKHTPGPDPETAAEQDRQKAAAIEAESSLEAERDCLKAINVELLGIAISTDELLEELKQLTNKDGKNLIGKVQQQISATIARAKEARP